MTSGDPDDSRMTDDDYHALDPRVVTLWRLSYLIGFGILLLALSSTGRDCVLYMDRLGLLVSCAMGHAVCDSGLADVLAATTSLQSLELPY